MAGIDRETGKALGGFAHVEQSLRVIFSTRIGSRVMRRTFGSAVPTMLGRNLTKSLILRFKTAIIIAVELWEPRYKIVAVTHEGADADDMRRGWFPLQIVGYYRPRGHLGDPTSDNLIRSVVIERDGSTS